MRVLAIDPGPERSAVIQLDGEAVKIAFIEKNQHVLDYLYCCRLAHHNFSEEVRNRGGTPGSRMPLVIEMIASYGMAVGASVFETCVWVGRFTEIYGAEHTSRLYRSNIKLHLCKDSRAKDANVRQAIMDRYGSTREKAIGTKKNPGPLYKVKTHLWSAMAVGLTWLDANAHTGKQ